MLSSPPGQFNEVLRDVKKLLPANLLTDIVTTNVARAYNVKTGRVVISPDHNKVVLFNASEVDATHYTDPITQHIFTVDHLTLVWLLIVLLYVDQLCMYRLSPAYIITIFYLPCIY